MTFGWLLMAPYYPCPWTFDRNHPSRAVRDGPKWTCGLPEIQAAKRPETERCVVYSFGSRVEVTFEVRVLKLAPSCEIHIFDQTNPVRPYAEPVNLARDFPEGIPYSRTSHFHCRRLRGESAPFALVAAPPRL